VYAPNGYHDGLVARGYLFIFLRPAEPVLRIRSSSGVAMSQMVGAGAQLPRGGPGAAPGREAGAEATGTHGSPGAVLSREAGAGAAGTHGSPGAAPSLGGGSRCLDLMLVRGGTRSSGYRQWPLGPPQERLRTRGCGQHPFPAHPFSVFIRWDSEAAVQHDRYVATHDSRGRCDARRTVTRCSSTWAVTAQRESCGPRQS
jgi:hypothetical protein